MVLLFVPVTSLQGSLLERAAFGLHLALPGVFLGQFGHGYVLAEGFSMGLLVT